MNYTKQGGNETVIEGVLNVTGKLELNGTELKQAENQADSTATTVAQVKDDFNALLAKLQAAGIMKAGS